MKLDGCPQDRRDASHRPQTVRRAAEGVTLAIPSRSVGQAGRRDMRYREQRGQAKRSEKADRRLIVHFLREEPSSYIHGSRAVDLYSNPRTHVGFPISSLANKAVFPVFPLLLACLLASSNYTAPHRTAPKKRTWYFPHQSPITSHARNAPPRPNNNRDPSHFRQIICKGIKKIQPGKLKRHLVLRLLAAETLQHVLPALLLEHQGWQIAFLDALASEFPQGLVDGSLVHQHAAL